MSASDLIVKSAESGNDKKETAMNQMINDITKDLNILFGNAPYDMADNKLANNILWAKKIEAKYGGSIRKLCALVNVHPGKKSASLLW